MSVVPAGSVPLYVVGARRRGSFRSGHEADRPNGRPPRRGRTRLRFPASCGIAVLALSLLVGCQPKEPSSGPLHGDEELRFLTPEQERQLHEQAARVEPQETVTHTLTNERGEAIGTVTSQTTVIFLQAGAGGGRFSVNTTCTSTCSGTPVKLDPSKPNNTCACNADCNKCTGAVDEQGCTGSCSKSSVGFGNFGIFIAREGRSAAGPRPT